MFHVTETFVLFGGAGPSLTLKRPLCGESMRNFTEPARHSPPSAGENVGQDDLKEKDEGAKNGKNHDRNSFMADSYREDRAPHKLSFVYTFMKCSGRWWMIL